MTLLYFIIFSFLQTLWVNEKLDRWLVEIKPHDHCLDEWWTGIGSDSKHFLRKNLKVENWIVIEIPHRFSASLKQLPCVTTILVDEILESYNTIPNDPEFIRQYDMDLIGMPLAWDNTTGGLSTRGDTIVVAIIDDGFQTDHEDLVENIWHNRGEIPNDGLDNDINGYVDDYNGLNVLTGRDNHPLRSHGTSVSGIIGAIGNNGKGISGINWNVKIMLISYNNHISELVDAYQYALDMRKKYNQTLGKEGAFVVAVNLSSGLDYALPKNFPLWCSMYDKLGAEGILSVCSAPNNSHSVDEGGGLPSRCPSPFTINVTNVSPSDVIMDNAGYGRISIDLGAPGENSLTTDTNNTYNYFRGTSAAAPHVAGTIALLYSIGCDSFFNDLHLDRSGIATKIKNVILHSAKPNPSLEGITLTGKRLDTDGAVRAIITDCGSEEDQNVSIRFLSPNPTNGERVRIFFEVFQDITNTYFDLYKLDGAKIYSIPINPEAYLKGYLDLETKSLAQGLYILTLRNNKNISTAKLFVNRE